MKVGASVARESLCEGYKTGGLFVSVKKLVAIQCGKVQLSCQKFAVGEGNGLEMINLSKYA